MAKTTVKEDEQAQHLDKLQRVLSAEDLYAEFNVDKGNAITEDEKKELGKQGFPFFITLCELLDGGKVNPENPDGLYWILTVDLNGQPKKLFMSWRQDTDAEFQGYRIVTEQRKMAVGPMRLNHTITKNGYDFYWLTGYRAIENKPQDALPF